MHRDVKPGNLLIEQSSDDDPDHVYLADFGLTKHAMSRSGLTSTGQFLGTVDYVAPEQILGMSVLGSADQYSLGCVLYECLTGRVPFEKDLDAAIIWAHVEESPTTPTELRPDLPPAVDDVFARVLAKQPGDRYGSCREFIEATRAALGSLAAEPQAGGIPGSNALDPLPEPPVERVAAGAQAVRAHEGDTMTSHRRQAAGAPPGETGDRWRPSRFPRTARAAALVPAAGLDSGPDRADPDRRGRGYLGPGQRRVRIPCAQHSHDTIHVGQAKGTDQRADERAHSGEPERGCQRPAAALDLQAAEHDDGDLHRPGARYHRSRLPDLSVAHCSVRCVHRFCQIAELRPVHGEFPGLRYE